MYELIRTGEKSDMIQCPAKMGVYCADEKNVYLIDSGNDKDAGKKALRILKENDWTLRGILLTHSHADHIGGSRYLQQQTGCKVFARGIEAAFTRDPILEPAFLFGGYPCRDLRHKFLMAQGCETTDFSDPDFPKEVEVIPLPGHSFDMVGFRTPDQVVFLADSVSSEQTLQKYAVSFLYDVEAYLRTLDSIKAMKAAMFVPAHAPACTDIAPLAEYNREKVLDIAARIEALCAKPASFEEVLKGIFDAYALEMTFEQHVLVGSTVRSYLAFLRDRGTLEVSFEGNIMRWAARQTA